MSDRTYQKRYKDLTIDELRSCSNNYYIVAKCDLNCKESVYPCRPSEKREYKWKGDRPRIYEFPNMDESTWTFPKGKFTTWLRTEEIKNALAHNHIVKTHEAIITFQNIEHKRKWEKLSKQVYKKHGKKCMRCGSEHKKTEIDHIKQWSTNPSLRYDIENLQVLCTDCHNWKTEQNRLGFDGDDLDFRCTQ